MRSAAPRLSIFAVEDTSAQVVWRGLRPGELRLAPAGAPAATVPIGPGHPAGAVVLHHLPPGRVVEIAVSGSAVGAAEILRTRTPPRLPGEELGRVATIGDLHLGARSFGHRHTIVERPAPAVPHPLRCTDAALAEATAWGAHTVVAKGDLTNNGQVDQWRSYADLVHRSAVPVFGLPGNHDRAFRAGLSPEDAALAFGFAMASPVQVVDRPGHRLVLVDSTTGGHNHGRIEGVADLVLDAVADTAPDSVALVFLHHQLQQYPVREVWPVGVGRLESARFLERLAATGTRTLVSSGHTHRHRRWTHRGVVATQVGSTKDYPGVWAGYVVTEGGVRQVVHRVADRDCIRWTDHTRRAAAGTWRWVAPGSLGTRCFDQTWEPGVGGRRSASS
ncbi:MAG TPA: metallophosphoesterase [Acidimicrobiales bacterium]|nr:metallophosphoesterase [Acidimicrobiales bacterium]HMS87752.1 metallophosphoesterase [Acidimicrobiales bacterium]HRA33400.1 metallophosphoesterase [Acidimicrobiales bacterium]